MYEVFDHTADLGLRIRAPDLPGLLADAGRALFSLIVENTDAVRPVEAVTLRVDGRDPAHLLFDWLSELLYTWETRGLLLTAFDVTVDDAGLAAVARGERADPDRHRLDHEVKAITYHGLRAEPSEDGWIAEVIVDL